jgi:hypothetical protein
MDSKQKYKIRECFLNSSNMTPISYFTHLTQLIRMILEYS